MSDGRISQGDIVEASAYQEAVDLNARIQDLVASFTQLKSVANSFEIKIDGAAGIKGLMDTLREISTASKNVQDLKNNLSGLSAEMAKLTKAQNDSTEATKRNNEVKNQANTTTNTSASSLQAEAQALYNSIKAREQAAKAYREEAALKKSAALASTDAAEKTRLEAEAKQLLSAALNEEKANKKDLATANKQVSATVKDNIAAETLLTRELDRLNAAAERQIQEANKQSNAYEQLKREYNEAAYATKTLAAEYVMLQRTGNAANDELARMKQTLDAQQKSTLNQSNALLQLEQAVGQNQRAVGRYANATGEITQILRELPNFAISAQTGILSLSNNLPMLQASLSRLAQTIDANTGKAIGWTGVLKTVSASIFSVQGLIILATTLLVAYGDKIPSIISGTVALDKANESYKKNLSGAVDGISKQVGQLSMLKYAIDNSAVSQEKKNQILRDTQKMMPGYLDSINSENLQHAITNQLIEDQINLLIKQAQHKAAIQSVNDAEKELILSQQKLNDSIGFWEKSFAFIKGYNGILAGLSPKQHVIADRIIDIKNAEDQLDISIKRATNSYYDRNLTIQKEIDALEKERNGIKETTSTISEYYREASGNVRNHLYTVTKLTDAEKAHKLSIDQKIDSLKAEISANNDLAESMDALITKTKRVISDNDLDVIKAENNARRFAKGTKERLNADLQAIDARTAKKRKALKDEYGTNEVALKQNAEYLTRDSEIYTKAAEEKDAALESFEKKNKPKKQRTKEPFDATNEILDANQRIFEANQALAKQELESQNSHLENIFNVESVSLDKRLDAYEQYVANLQGIQSIENRNAIEEKEKMLEQISSIEKRTNFVVTEENLKQIETLKGVSNEERKLMLQKFALQAEVETLTKNHQNKLEEIYEAAQKKEREIIDSNIKYQIAQQNARFNALRDEASRETAMRLASLNEMRSKREVSEKSYWRMRQTISASESRILFDKELELLQQYKKQILGDPSIPQAVKDNVDKLMGDLEKMRPEPKKTESKTLLEYLGFTNANSEEVDAAAETVSKFRAEIDKANIAIAFAREQRSTTEESAANQWGIDSKEYADAVIAAANAEAKAIGEATIIKEAATKSYQVAMENLAEIQSKIAETYKQKIAQQLQELISTMFDAVAESRNNYYTDRFSQLDEEAKKIAENAEDEKLKVQQTITNEKEKAAALEKIENDKITNDRRIDNQRKALKRQQAVREKADAIFQAGLNGGIAVAKALASINPSMGPAGVALAKVSAALIAIQTAATIATLIARPIPAYWKGTPAEGHPGGLALVGERGAELVNLPGGKSFLTPDQPTVMDLPKGTEVVSNKELASAAQKNAMAEMGNLKQEVTPEIYMDALIRSFRDEMTEHTAGVIDAIKNKKETHFRLENGQWVKSVEVGNVWTDYVGGLV